MPNIVPLRDVAHRLPEHGRIRIGAKSEKGFPSKLTTFRFTSSDSEAIKAIAGLYGGEAKPWSGSPRAGEWEVVTKAKEIPIALPPNALGETPIYELWSGGGLVRRCDGEESQVARATPDGAEFTAVPCVCEQKKELACKVKIRLNIIMRDVRFNGVWRLESSSWNVAHEMPGMVEMIGSLQTQGIVRGILRLEERMKKTGGKTHKFVIPMLGIDDTIEGLVAGTQAMTALAPSESPVAALGAGDDEVIDGELVED